MKTLLCLSLTCLIIKHKVGFELNLFTKQTNINKVFLFFLFFILDMIGFVSLAFLLCYCSLSLG